MPMEKGKLVSGILVNTLDADNQDIEISVSECCANT